MVENQRNSCRFPYFDNAYFKPSKMELVLNVAKESSFSLTVCKLQVIQWVHFLNLKSCDILRDLFSRLLITLLSQSDCQTLEISLWKGVPEFVGGFWRGFKFQPIFLFKCHPIFLWVWRKSWWIVLVQMCPFLTVYGYEKYYMTVNIIDMELIMDSLEINSGVSNRPNAKLGIIVR